MLFRSPKRALVFDDEQIFVFRLREGAPEAAAAGSDAGEEDAEGDEDAQDGAAGGEPALTVERLLVRPLLEDRDNVEPAEGFAAGDRIVVAGQAGLKDGSEVRLVGTEG